MRTKKSAMVKKKDIFEIFSGHRNCSLRIYMLFSEEIMINHKNILIVIDNGIIGLDIMKQLHGYGYNAEIVNLVNIEKISEILERGFKLVILERCRNNQGNEYVLKLARRYNLPVIYLATDNETGHVDIKGLRMLMMPFGGEDLKEAVRISLSEN